VGVHGERRSNALITKIVSSGRPTADSIVVRVNCTTSRNCSGETWSDLFSTTMSSPDSRTTSRRRSSSAPEIGGRPSRRGGVEWTNYARVTPWLTIDGDLAFSRARFRNDDPAGDHIPGALDRVISAGVTIEARQPFFGSLRVRHFGPRPLIEDATVNSSSTTLWNGEVGYRVSRKARLVLELFNIFDAEVSDIDYFYTSRLLGEPAGGVDDVHTHPALPRSARFGLQVSF